MKALANVKSLNALCSAIVLVGAFLLPNITYASITAFSAQPQLGSFTETVLYFNPDHALLQTFIEFDDIGVYYADFNLYDANDCSGSSLDSGSYFGYNQPLSGTTQGYSMNVFDATGIGEIVVDSIKVNLYDIDEILITDYCLNEASFDTPFPISFLNLPSGGTASSTYDLLQFDIMSTTSFYGILVFFISLFTTIWIWSTFIL